jgi:hypothetical protein
VPSHCLANDLLRQPAQGVVLRSSLIGSDVSTGSRVGKKLETALHDHHFKKPNPFTVPSGSVHRAFDTLRRDMVTQMQLEKYLQKREQERNDLRMQVDPGMAQTVIAQAHTIVQKAVTDAMFQNQQ